MQFLTIFARCWVWFDLKIEPKTILHHCDSFSGTFISLQRQWRTCEFHPLLVALLQLSILAYQYHPASYFVHPFGLLAAVLRQ